MVQINGNNFKVYNLDTIQSILNRLAAFMKTKPSYLYFPGGVPTLEEINSNENIQVENMLGTLKTAAEGLGFDKFYNQNKDKFSNEILFETDILIPFIIYNKTILSAPKGFEGTMIFVIKTDLDKLNLTNRLPNLEDIWSDRAKFIKRLDDDINKNKVLVEREVRLFAEFQKIKKGIPFTKFELEKVIFEIILDLTDISLMELFNAIELSPSIPFATSKEFYKILKDFVPHPKWSISVEDVIIMKILERESTQMVKLDNYTDALISVSGEPGEEVVSASLHLSTSGYNLSRSAFIDRFLGSFRGFGNIKIKSTQESQVNGPFYFPKHSLNKYVFADLVMNNPIFSNILSINESDKASKKKLYIHFNHPKIGYVTANITEGVVKKGDPYLKGKSIEVFPLSSRYIRVKISKCENIQSVKGFQEILSKLFVIYDQEYQNIVDIYREFLPDFGKVSPIPSPPKRNLKLKDIAPDVFLSGYSRKCLKKPIIVSDEEAETLKNKGASVMVFPKEGEGSVPRNYVCEKHPNHKYPGFRDNPLGNSAEFPYLPCCYTKNQAELKGSRYRHYYFGEEIPDREVIQQDLYTTNKFVPFNIFGTLPKNIQRLFNVIDTDSKYMFIRKGVVRGMSSFLNCVLEALKIDDVSEMVDTDEIDAYLYDVREKLATKVSAATCRQEMYDYNTTEIQEAIRNPDVYFDPKKFVALLENAYNCNIYIFSRKTMNGEMILPRHLQAYYKNKRTGPSIFIFEHMGSESDHAKYPQCELIGRWKVIESENVTYSFEHRNNISTSVRTVSQKLRKAYSLSKTIPDVVFPIKTPNVQYIGRGIDSYGKCRMIKVKFKDQIATLLTTPIQPLPIEEFQNWDITKVNQDVVVELAAAFKMLISGQTIVNEISKEIYGKIGNVSVSIPTKDGSVIGGVPTLDEGIGYPENNYSNVRVYNKYKKMTRYVIEYMFWMYSRYLHDNGEDEPTLDNILQFRKDMIKIDDSFVYNDVPKTFSMDDNGIISGGKLIVRSEETLKRLMYVLRMTALRDKKRMIEYKKRNFINNYYIDIADFTSYSSQVILEGKDSVQKWIQEQKIKYNLNNEVVISTKTPYFFKNDFFGDDIFLAQNTDSVQKAVSIAQTWYNEQYNPGDDPEKEKMVTYHLYSYSNPNDIIPYKVVGDPTPHDIYILGYKIEDTPFFTTLLPL